MTRQIQIADLTASANEIDTRMGPIPGRSSDRIANELRWAATELERLLKEREDVARAIFGDGWKCCLNLGPYVQSTVSELTALRAVVARPRAGAPSHEAIIDAIFENVRQHMSGGKCPTHGCLGECAIIAPVCEAHDGSGRIVYTAACYIWDEQFNDSALLASWFQEAGAKGVTVSHVLFDEDNGDRDGKAGDMDGVRAWNVDFVLERAAEVGQ